MTQAQHILDSFSDSLVAAMMDGGNAAADVVLASYKQRYPELTSSLDERRASLTLLYGFLSDVEHPDDSEIARVYKHFAPKPQPIRAQAAPQKKFVRSFGSFFRSPSWGLAASLATIAVLVIVWHPWETTSTDSLLRPAVSDVPQPTVAPPQSNGQANNTASSTESPTFRGLDNASMHSSARQDSIDAIRLEKLASRTTLSAPKNLELAASSPGTVVVHADRVNGAISYIVEIRGTNDKTFRPVTQTAHPNARIRSLQSGDTVSVRMIAASGERQGPPSDAKRIVVP